jgi:hypothetical protein
MHGSELDYGMTTSVTSRGRAKKRDNQSAFVAPHQRASTTFKRPCQGMGLRGTDGPDLAAALEACEPGDADETDQRPFWK